MSERDHKEAQDVLKNNLEQVEALYARLLAAVQKAPSVRHDLNAPDPNLFAEAFVKSWQTMLENPAKLYEAQVGYWNDAIEAFITMQRDVISGEITKDDAPVGDRRFAHGLWSTHPYFKFVKDQYFKNAQALRHATEAVEGMQEIDKRRLTFVTEQIIDLMAPTNFLATNPEALEEAVATEGRSLVKGLENLIRDVEKNNGLFAVGLSDPDAYEVGKTVAYTDGAVVHRTPMYELLQYTPTTDTVHSVPIIIYPPWINKYYILDLQDKNSLIKWLVDQGFTVFVVSWINPDASHRDVGLMEYIRDGYMDAITAVRAITEQPKVNAIGYCIAGTTLQLSLSYMKQVGFDAPETATFFTTLTDFSNHGEFTAFLHDDFVTGIEKQVNADGVLNAYIMQRTMSFLRSKDLVYGPAIRNYLLGKEAPAFDLLFWNEDGANLPAKMTVEYLRQLCQANEFVGEGVSFEEGVTLHARDVTLPVYYVTCESDHIAPWLDCYRGMQATGSADKIFVLSESGHVAGIVNAPPRKKYGHYVNADLEQSAEEWKHSATFKEGSWWPHFGTWLAAQSGDKIPARPVGHADFPVICAAPGEYVLRRAAEAFAATQKNS